MWCALFYLVFITGARLGLGGFTSGAPCSERNTAVLHKSYWQMPNETVECVDITPMRKSTRAPFAHQVVEATTLYADHMRLTRVPLFVFTMMPHLQLVDLSGNKLRRISKDAFLSLCSFHTLLLEGNRVAVPKKTPLLSSPSLKTLMLSNNKIRMLRPQTFCQLQALTVLYLDRNWLVRVHPKVFSPLKHLKYLHLGNNRLKVLPHVVLAAPKAVLIVAGNPLNSTEEYTVRRGTMDMGKEYEIQMAALLSLRCVLSTEEDMWLASNPEGVGALDDIVVNVKRSGGSTLTYMLQMKHKEDPTPITRDEYLSSNIKHQYRLVKYYTDIEYLETAMGPTSTKKDIIKDLGKFRNIYFILFTNRPTNSCAFLKSVDKNHHVSNLAFVDTSNSTKSNAYILDTKQLDTAICKDKSFKFYLLTNQVHGNSLNEKIIQELERIADKLGLNNVKCKEVSEKYTKFITKWAKGDLGGHYYLTKKDVISKLASLLLSQYEFNLATFQEYTGEGMSTWKEIIREKSIIFVDSTELVQEFLIRGIVNEVLRYCNKPYKSWTDSFDKKAKQWFYTTYNNLERDMFKIVGQFEPITLLDLYKCLWKVEIGPLILQVRKEEEYKSIISILKFSAPHPPVVMLNKIDNFSPKSESGFDMFSYLQDLGEEQRQKVLDNTVKIQGRNSAKLKDLVDETMFGHITTRDIIYILSNQFNVGGKLSELHPLFIERSAMKVFLKAKVLEKVKGEIFLLSGCSGNHGYQALKDVDLTALGTQGIFTISKVEDELTQTLKSIPHRTIHCLSVYDENLLEWRWSSGTTKNIRPFREYIDNQSSDEENFVSISSSSCITKNKKIFRKFTDVFQDATNIISDVPGMGKSLLMDFVALRAPPSQWVIRIDLHKHQKYYRELGNSKSKTSWQHLNNFYETLLSKDQCNVKLDKMIFQKLEKEKNILVILDGFDEVPISYKDEVTNMAKCLQAAGFKLWLTTRPHMKGYLEEEFDTFTTSLKSFALCDQTKYLIEYFSNKTPNSMVSPTEFVEGLLRTVISNLGDWEQELTGIPLQTNLLADYFSDQWNEVARNGMKGSFNETVNLLKLYRSFMTKQCDRLYNKLGEEQITDTYEDVVQHQKLFALQLVFSSERFSEIDIIKDLNDYYAKNPSKTALLQRDGIMIITERGDLSCIHQTFAEYLAAEWLWKNVRSSDLQLKEMSLSLIKERSTRRYNFLFYILDLFVTQNCPLHTAILERHVSDAERMIKEETDKAVFAKDEFRRSVLHVLSLGFDTIDIKLIDDLPIIYRDIYSEPDIIGYTPLDYSLESNMPYLFLDAVNRKINYSVISAHISIDTDYNYLTFFHNTNVSLFNTLLAYFISRLLLLNYVEMGFAGKRMVKDRNIASYLNDMKINHSINVTALKYLQLGEARLYSGYSNNYYSDIRFAFAFGCKQNIKKLLSEGVEVNKQDVDGNTVLHYAVPLGDIEIVKDLLSKGALSGIANIYSVTPLHVAKMDGHSLIFETLFSSLLNSGRTYGETPVLHYVVQYGRYQDVKKFLNKSVVNKADPKINTPLHLAVRMAKFDIAKLLLDYGANVNLRNVRGKTPVHLAIKRAMPGDIFLLLLSNARVNIPDNLGNTALHVAVKHKLRMGSLADSTDKKYTTNIAEESPFHIFRNMWVPYLLCLDYEDENKYGEEFDNDVVRLLINKGIDVNVKNGAGYTALYTSIRGGDFFSVRKMLSKSALADINKQDTWGDTYLHVALQTFHLKIILSLIASGIDLNIQNNRGQTALHISATKDYYVTCLLLRFGADIDAKDRDGNSALHLALRHRCIATTNLLLSTQVGIDADTYMYNRCPTIRERRTRRYADINMKNNNGWTSLHYASKNGYDNLVEIILNKGSIIDEQNDEGNTSLHLAVTEGHLDVVKVLISKGARVDVINFGERHTPLHLAVICNKVDIIRILLDNGANVFKLTKWGENVLHLVEDYDTAVNFIQKGVDVNAADQRGKMPLHIAAERNKLNITKLFLAKGASVDIQDELGNTPLIYASSVGMFTELIFQGADINKQKILGETALTVALAEADFLKMLVLLAFGGNINFNNELQKEALRVAMESALRTKVFYVTNQSRYWKEGGIFKYQAMLKQWTSLLNLVMIECHNDLDLGAPNLDDPWITHEERIPYEYYLDFDKYKLYKECGKSYNSFYSGVLELFYRKGLALRRSNC